MYRISLEKLYLHNKVLKYFESILVLFICLIFIILPQINIFEYVQSTITSKFIFFTYGCILLVVFYFTQLLISGKAVILISKLDFALLLLLSYISLNRYFIQSYFGFSIRYIELLGLSFLYISLKRLSFKNYPWLLLAIIVSGIGQAVYGTLQLMGYCMSNHPGFKMTGSFFNPGPYAGFLVSVWPIAMGMYLFKDKIISQLHSSFEKNSFLICNGTIKMAFEYIPLLGLISIALVLPATQSRAAWLAAVISSLILIELRYLILKKYFKKSNAFKKACLIISFIGLISLGLFVVYNLKKESSDGRLFIWKVTTNMIAETPVFGIGFDLFKANYMNEQADYFAKNGKTSEAMVADNTYYTFNDWLQFTAENGLLGFALLSMTIFFLFKIKVSKEIHFIPLICRMCLLTIGIFAIFSYPVQILPIKVLLISTLAILSKNDAKQYTLICTEEKKRLWVFKTAIIFLGFICIEKSTSYIEDLDEGFRTWENALKWQQYRYYKGALMAYNSAYDVFKNDGDFLMNYGQALAISGDYHKAIIILERAKHFLNTSIIEISLGNSYKAIKEYNKAEMAYQQAADMVPSKFYANYLLAKLYDDSGQARKAIAMARKIQNKEVKVPSKAIIEIQDAMKKILIKYKKP